MADIVSVNYHRVRNVFRRAWWLAGNRSFSQKGEDLVLFDLLGRKRDGFYVDVGAHRPIQISNSFYFYIRGWHGLTIEPQVDLFDLHSRARRRDIQLNIGVGPRGEAMEFYKMNHSTLSTFSRGEAMRMAAMPGHEIVEVISVPVMPLSDVLQKYAHSTPIDFFSVDAEGGDIAVLNSNQWDRFRPTIVVVETLAYRATGVHEEQNDQTGVFVEYFKGINYEPVWSNGLNTFFKRMDS